MPGEEPDCQEHPRHPHRPPERVGRKPERWAGHVSSEDADLDCSQDRPPAPWRAPTHPTVEGAEGDEEDRGPEMNGRVAGKLPLHGGDQRPGQQGDPTESDQLADRVRKHPPAQELTAGAFTGQRMVHGATLPPPRNPASVRASERPMIHEGQTAPSFTLKDSTGRPWSLDALRASGPVVLFFYPRDESPICTREVCAFRDAHQDFAEAGATVVGISSDGEAAHEAFARKQRLNYVLLSDPDGKVRKAYDIPKTLGVLDGRATYVVDAAGVVRMAYAAQLVAEGHTRRALEMVRTLRGAGTAAGAH